MSLTDLYLVTTKNLNDFLTALHTAQAPEKFTQKFLESLEFKSTNDRLFIKMLKELGFIDSNGKPTDRYYQYLDQTQSQQILAEALRESYADLFQINKEANKLTVAEIKSKLKTLTQGKKSDKVYSLMANTFEALCKLADFSGKVEGKKTIVEKTEPQNDILEDSQPREEFKNGNSTTSYTPHYQLAYNIQIHLPETRDTSVYEAIFSSLKKHLS